MKKKTQKVLEVWQEMNTLQRVMAAFFPLSSVTSSCHLNHDLKMEHKVSVVYGEDDENKITERYDVQLIAVRMKWTITKNSNNGLYLERLL